MATDKTEPENGTDSAVGILAIVTLLVVHAALSAYFDRMAKAEVLRKLGSPEALVNLRADEKRACPPGATPIDKRCRRSSRRAAWAPVPAIAPSVSKDMAPLQGWTKMPGDVPAAMTAPPAPTAPELPGDAGAALAGASAMNAKPDAGATAAPARSQATT